jgi:hypothetical protein
LDVGLEAGLGEGFDDNDCVPTALVAQIELWPALLTNAELMTKTMREGEWADGDLAALARC